MTAREVAEALYEKLSDMRTEIDYWNGYLDAIKQVENYLDGLKLMREEEEK